MERVDLPYLHDDPSTRRLDCPSARPDLDIGHHPAVLMFENVAVVDELADHALAQKRDDDLHDARRGAALVGHVDRIEQRARS